MRQPPFLTCNGVNAARLREYGGDLNLAPHMYSSGPPSSISFSRKWQGRMVSYWNWKLSIAVQPAQLERSPLLSVIRDWHARIVVTIAARAIAAALIVTI